jgi:BirA family biotin operon repressor/biotin-[acetyl-CoA-carboxylase] ligase
VKAEVLLRALADGEPHSGEDLARALEVTRAAIWKSIPKLANWGLDVDAIPGVGYRLARPIDLLDAAELRAALAPSAAPRVARLEVFTELDSTNRFLLESPPPRTGTVDVCIAEYQHAGRGRRGRRWSTPLGAGLCLSAAWCFDGSPAGLPALTLAVGVVVRRALAQAAGLAIGLKWPNDLVFHDRKLGGILLELEAEAHGRCRVVAGIGINFAVPPSELPLLSDWGRGAIDLATAAERAPPPRAVVALRVIEGLVDLFSGYATSGFEPFRAEWMRADCLAGRRVALEGGGGRMTGTAAGIEPDGALVIETEDGNRRRVVSGDVSLRSA